MVWYFHLLKNFPQFVVIHTAKDFAVIDEAEVDVFLEFSYFFYDPVDVGNLISGSSAFSKTSLNIWKFMAHILLKPGLENFEHYFTSVRDECNCVAREFQKNICFIDYTKAFDCVDHNKLWKILKEMVIPDHLMCLQRNLYAGQEATVRTGHGTTDWFQIGKGVCQGCILSPCLFKLHAEYVM